MLRSEDDAALSAPKLRLLDQWLSGREATATITRRRVSSARLSFAQERMWFLSRLHPDSAYLNMVESLRLTGSLNVPALRYALEEIVRRHESLRTVYAVEGEEVRQVVLDEVPLPLTIATEPADPAEWLRGESQRPFDLATKPPVRFHLARLGRDEHVLMVTLHHIAGDGASIGIFFRELFELYDAADSDRAVTLGPVEVQYTDFAEWQRETVSGPSLTEQLEYWKHRLGEPEPVIGLLADRARSGAPSLRVHSAGLALSEKDSAVFRAVARGHEATLFMTVLAVFKALLHRRTGRTDLTVGSVVHGRDQRETENVIGMFANTLALRTDFTGADSFADLLGAVRQTCLSSYEHRDTPIELLVAELGAGRNRGHNPLFQIACVWESTAGRAKMGPLRVDAFDFDLDASEFDLMLFCWENEGRLEASLRGSVDLFDQETVDRLAAQLTEVLTAVAEKPDQPLSGLVPDAVVSSAPATEEAQTPVADRGRAPVERELTPTERAVAQAFTDVLGQSVIGVDDDFFEIGGHSLRAVRMLLRLGQQLGVSIVPQAFFDLPTVAGLAATIDRAAQAKAGEADEVDLAAEVVLPGDITAQGSPAVGPSAVQNVLLTGADSFAGVHVLAELLTATTARVHCVVDAGGPAEADHLLDSAFATYRLGTVPRDRVSVLAGGLGEPLLGLSPITFDQLAGLVDVVYHLGCEANLAQTYRRLKAANVDGTREVLRFATRRRVKAVHHLSSPGVLFPRGAESPVLAEDAHVDASSVLPSGYVRSRWVAEELVRAAGARGVPVTIYRPGRLLGSSRTGADEVGNAFWRFMKACVEIGGVPDLPGLDLDLSPVDYLAAALVRLSLREDTAGASFHLANPERTRLDLVVEHLRGLGHRLDPMSSQQWSNALSAAAGQANAGSATTSVALLAGASGGMPQLGSLRLDVSRALAALEGTGVRCPQVDEDLLAKYLGFFHDVGFLTTPATPQEDTHVVR